jgi:hypothetical protein
MGIIQTRPRREEERGMELFSEVDPFSCLLFGMGVAGLLIGGALGVVVGLVIHYVRR